jgi:oligopeptide transport system ATP-binding protein
MEPILEVNNLKVRFRVKGGYVYAVNGITYQLSESESLGIVGESGCGKSVSVMSIMKLIDQPPGEITSGEILYMKRDLLKMSSNEIRQVRGKEIGMIFQDPMTSLNPVLTIGRQMTEVLQLHMLMDRKQAKARSAELLTMVGIPKAADRLDDYPHQFSGGMRQRVMIAMSLACVPQVLIADEPTTALDVTIQAQIVDLVRKLRDELGMAVIWITHDLGVVASFAQRVIVMYAGYIIEEATAKEVYANPSHPYTLGLLGSLPRVDKGERHRLVSIDGLPPTLGEEPKSCPFAARCTYVIDRCKQENPPLIPVGPEHRSACWVDVKTRRPRA